MAVVSNKNIANVFRKMLRGVPNTASAADLRHHIEETNKMTKEAFEEVNKQLLDAQTLASIRSGFQDKSGIKIELDPLQFKPGEWRVVDNLDQHAPGAKLDAGKADMSLLQMFSRALYEVAAVGTGGMKKYTRGGWQSVDDGYNRYSAAMLRHYFTDEEYDRDIESWAGKEILHDASVAWNALARLELKLREMEKNDSKHISS